MRKKVWDFAIAAERPPLPFLSEVCPTSNIQKLDFWPVIGDETRCGFDQAGHIVWGQHARQLARTINARHLLL
jgi:hypothetical protein